MKLLTRKRKSLKWVQVYDQWSHWSEVKTKSHATSSQGLADQQLEIEKLRHFLEAHKKAMQVQIRRKQQEVVMWSSSRWHHPIISSWLPSTRFWVFGHLGSLRIIKWWRVDTESQYGSCISRAGLCNCIFGRRQVLVWWMRSVYQEMAFQPDLACSPPELIKCSQPPQLSQS